MVKNHSGNPLPPHGLRFPISSKGSFYMHNHTDRIAHTTAFVTPVVELWQKREIARTYQFPSLKCAHISLWLNLTGHSKFHDTANHPPPATDSGRTPRTPLYPPVKAVPPYSLPPPLFSCTGQRNQRRPVPVPVTGVRYNSLL